MVGKRKSTKAQKESPRLLRHWLIPFVVLVLASIIPVRTYGKIGEFSIFLPLLLVAAYVAYDAIKNYGWRGAHVLPTALLAGSLVGSFLMYHLEPPHKTSGLSGILFGLFGIGLYVVVQLVASITIRIRKDKKKKLAKQK